MSWQSILKISFKGAGDDPNKRGRVGYPRDENGVRSKASFYRNWSEGNQVDELLSNGPLTLYSIIMYLKTKQKKYLNREKYTQEAVYSLMEKTGMYGSMTAAAGEEVYGYLMANSENRFNKPESEITMKYGWEGYNHRNPSRLDTLWRKI